MAVNLYVELLDFKKRPFYDRNGVKKCDGRLSIHSIIEKEVKRLKKLEKRRACFLQVLAGSSPEKAKPVSMPVEI